MARLKFDYIKIGKYKRPIIPVRLSFQGKSVNTPALIDSGADFNVFHLSLANDLGLKLNLNKPTKFGGIGDKRPKFTGYMGIVDIMVFKKGEKFNFETPVFFSDDIPKNGFPLLGEIGFFDHLQEICFYYQRGKVAIQSKN